MKHNKQNIKDNQTNQHKQSVSDAELANVTGGVQLGRPLTDCSGNSRETCEKNGCMWVSNSKNGCIPFT